MSTPTPTQAQTLPPPRRIAVIHNTTTGAQEILDDTLTMTETGMGPTIGMGYVHERVMGDPKDGLKGTKAVPDFKWLQSNGVTFSFIDLPDGNDQPMHYTNTVDLQVVVFGSVMLTYHDGTTKTVNEGDFIIHSACVHKWTNTVTGKPCRLFGICMPSKPVLVDGKGLDEVLGAFKFF